jgi:hypothetical protein
MPKSTQSPQPALVRLTARARARNLTDAEWARLAGMPKETLCRLRRRDNCDFTTMARLAAVVDSHLSITPGRAGPSDDGLWPANFDRADEEALVDALAAHESDINADALRQLGPPFFVAGLAVLISGARDVNRDRWLSLAEALHPGATALPAYQYWLDHAPVRAARFLPMWESARARPGKRSRVAA